MQQLKPILENRRHLYKILGSLYQTEIDSDSLKALKEFRFPEGSDDEALNEAGRSLNGFIADLREDGLDDLAADYARTFLSAGVADEPAAFPIESVYTSPAKLIMQDAYEAMAKILHAHGLSSKQDDLYPDHLGIELEFMGVLNDKALDLLEKSQESALVDNLQEQKNFQESHLLNWTEKFFDDQKSVARTPFYRALGEFSRAFLLQDHAWLSA